tara:strand:- start:125906 stop:126625 length:720 start_codon:yes stop_codon:yes gene_type:complete
MEKDHFSGKLRAASDNFLNKQSAIDISWLPKAAEKLLISGNINDYVITEIPIVSVDVPNRNLDLFPYDEVSSFNPETGALVYRSFVGKPTHRDHDNRDPRKAKGVIFDANLQKVAGTDLWKIVILAGWDRTKDRHVAESILRGEFKGHSMGALVGYTECNFPGCGATSPNGRIACRHMESGRGKGRLISAGAKQFVIAEICRQICYIESSVITNGNGAEGHGGQADPEAIQRWVKPWNG